MTEKEIFETGVSEEEYQYLNKGEKLEEFQWEKLFRGMYDDWIKKTNIHTPFAYLQKFLFPIHSYSKRIECVRYLQEIAIDIIDNEIYSKEWSDDFAGYIRYNERLRDLKAQNIFVTPGCYSKACWLDETALLIEHISPQEMITFVTHANQIADLLSIRRSPKHVVTYYSLIFRENSTAGIGNMRLMDFCHEFVAIEGYRAQLISGHKGRSYIPLNPISDECRTQCLEIYIQERIKHIREEIMEHDKTRPYKPSNHDCMKQMYEQDRTIVEAGVLILNNKQTTEWLQSNINSSVILEESKRRCEIKVQQLNEAYGVCCKIKEDKDIWQSVNDKLDYMVLLMQCYIRLLEEKMKQKPEDAMPKNIIINTEGGDYIAGNKYVGAPNEAGEEATTAFKPKDRRGPKFQVLFADKNGDEDSKRTHIEKDRLLGYIRDNDLMSQKLSSSKNDELLMVVVCFCKKWVEQGYVPTSMSPTALVRFLVETCGIAKKANQVSIANVLQPMLTSGKFDKQIFNQVCEYF